MTRHGRPRQEAGERPRGSIALAVELAIYNLVLLALAPAIVSWLVWRSLAQGKPLGSWRHRLGFVPRLPRGRLRIWLHAVSAGEVAAAKPVVEAIRAALPEAQVGISTVTAAGMEMASKSCGNASALFYLPLDGAVCVATALARLRPDLLVITEKELWPNLLGLARLAGVRVLVINGRVSDRMMRRARWAGAGVRWLYRLPDGYCVQSEEDARRLLTLGVSPSRAAVAGNTKVDGLARREAEAEAGLARELGVEAGEVWLVAGSTHQGEEEAVVEAFRMVRAELAGARLLLAPRHQDRVAAVSAMIAGQGLAAARRSEGTPASREAIVVLDTMGELRAAYGLAKAAFVGGTLVPIGGHNLLEPVAAGRAVLFGPHTANCSDVADLVVEAGVGFRVSSAQELAGRFLEIATDECLQSEIAARGKALLEQQRGAAARCAEAARALLGAGGGWRPG